MKLNLNDLVISRLRTVVPKLCGLALGALLVWLGAHTPWALTLLDLLDIDLSDPATVAAISLFVVGLAEVGWYELWRRLEPRLPDWLSRLTLGSSYTPTYAPLTPDGTHVITNLTTAEVQAIRLLRATARRDDPS